MNKLSIIEANQFIANAIITPSLEVDELLELAEFDENKIHELSFWADAYLVAKHPNGGEIYSRFYADFTINKDQKIDVGICLESFRITTMDLTITGDVMDVDDLSNDLDKAAVEKLTPNEDDAQLKEFLGKELVRLLDGKIDIESIKQSDRFVAM